MIGWARSNATQALVGLLFAASLAVLVASGAGAILLPHHEVEARERLRAAASELARAAEAISAEVPTPAAPGWPIAGEFDRRLGAVTARVLADYPPAEGGFYAGGAAEQFAGYAHPAAPTPRFDSPGEKPKKKDKSKEPPPGLARREPPPGEMPWVRRQARDVLAGSPGDLPVVEVRDVGPSRVAVACAAVGGERPAKFAAWVMLRLSGPAGRREQLRGYLASATLALGGVALALGLTVRLNRSLARERARRQRAERDLHKAEHLASLGALLAGVAHEVRNPLAAIRSTVQLWERLPGQSRTPASLAAVVGAVDRINELVGRLLYFARAGHEEFRPVDLAGVVAETLELSRAQAQAQGVELACEFGPAAPPVWGAPQALRQVALNLVANALQAMPAGGRLVCAVRSVGGAVELSVADTGPGLADAVRARLFEPFVTTRPDGTGLGLALCREVVAQHGGSIAFDPAPVAGAVVRVTIPASAAS